MSRPSLYFAGPLFSEAELDYNYRVAAELERWFDVYLPQRDGGLLVDLVSNGVAPRAAYQSIFERDIVALAACDVCLILLDGRAVDEGAAFELGYAFALKKLCVGLQTDSRRLMPLGNNPMLQCPLVQSFTTVDQLLDWARSFAGIGEDAFSDEGMKAAST